MLYAVLCYNDENVVGGWTEQEDAVVMERLAAVQQKYADRMGPVARLMNTATATTLRKTQAEPLVIDGPFAETKEQFLGFYTIEAPTLEDVLEFARELAVANPGMGSYEIRPLRNFFPGASSK